MRPMLVVPSEERSELIAKDSLPHRNLDPASCFVFHGPDESFNNSDASVLPDCAVTWPNLLASAPAFEGTATKDFVLIADQVLLIMVYDPPVR